MQRGRDGQRCPRVLVAVQRAAPGHRSPVQIALVVPADACVHRSAARRMEPGTLAAQPAARSRPRPSPKHRRHHRVGERVIGPSSARTEAHRQPLLDVVGRERARPALRTRPRERQRRGDGAMLATRVPTRACRRRTRPATCAGRELERVDEAREAFGEVRHPDRTPARSDDAPAPARVPGNHRVLVAQVIEFGAPRRSRHRRRSPGAATSDGPATDLRSYGDREVRATSISSIRGPNLRSRCASQLGVSAAPVEFSASGRRRA